jgi:large subunit ribosomal protein L20
MPRAKTTVPHIARRKKVMKAVRGGRGGRSKLYRTARETLFRALAYAYRDRRQRKRQFRQLWIMRINAAARINGLSYSQLIHGLKLAQVDLDRKTLAHLAVHDAEGFARVAETAREALPQAATAG